MAGKQRPSFKKSSSTTMEEYIRGGAKIKQAGLLEPLACLQAVTSLSFLLHL
jgi:hypothetical protein